MSEDWYKQLLLSYDIYDVRTNLTHLHPSPVHLRSVAASLHTRGGFVRGISILSLKGRFLSFSSFLQLDVPLEGAALCNPVKTTRDPLLLLAQSNS